jgi:hypothetical protein
MLSACSASALGGFLCPLLGGLCTMEAMFYVYLAFGDNILV